MDGINNLILLLGRTDSPTDGVLDYCLCIKDKLVEKNIGCISYKVEWEDKGWLYSMYKVIKDSEKWENNWVIIQYTSLNWSRRGFPIGILLIYWILSIRKCKIAVVYHDTSGYPVHRLIDRIRRIHQHMIMRFLYKHSKASIFTVPLNAINWLNDLKKDKANFIPVGPNIPPYIKVRRSGINKKSIAVFGVTGGKNMLKEAEDIIHATKYVSHHLRFNKKKVQLIVLGRGSRESEPLFHQLLDGSNIPLKVYGLLPAKEITQTLSNADVLLFVRGPISTRRGSAIAGIACGLPIVAYAGPETSFPITEAGVRLVPQGDRHQLAEALLEVLSDDNLWLNLHRRSIEAYKRYFSWDVITQQIISFLDNATS